MFTKSILLFSILFVFGFGIQESFATSEFLNTISSPPMSPSTISIPTQEVQINIDALLDDSMNITVFGKTIHVTHEQTIFRATNDFTYIGSTDGSFENVWIAYYDGDARLELNSPTNNYILEPSGKYHSITEFSEIAFGETEDGSDGLSLNPNYRQIVRDIPTGEFTRTTHHNLVIDIIYLYTDEAEDKKRQNGIRLMGNLGIDKINNAFVHADIPVQLRHVETSGVDRNYVESGIMKTELARLIDVTDNYMKRGSAVRDNENADVGFLFIDKVSKPGLCGRVNMILADADTAYLAINVNCRAPIGSVITHEFGHLAGAHHDRVTNGYYANVAFPYGHGYADAGNRLDTIMSYPCSGCEWQNIWSNPSKNFERTNTIAGTETRENNALVLTQTAPHMGSFRGGDEIFIINDSTRPVISLTGITSPLEVGVDSYTELGATVTDNDVTYSGTVTVGGVTVNTSVVGSYIVTYNAPADASGNTPIQVTRTVIVQDTIAPIIKLDGANPQIIELGIGYTELGATTNDSSPYTVDTSAFVDAVGSYNILYDSTDGTNAAIQITRTVTVQDTIAPTFNVDGNIINYSTEIELGTTYTLGTIQNIVDFSSTTSSISNTVNVNAKGTYPVTYTVTDASGNSKTIIETVTVILSATFPDAPTNLIVTIVNGTTIDLSWTAPSDGGSPITDYIIEHTREYRNNIILTIVNDGTSSITSTTVTDLLYGQTYNFVVSAVNDVGPSDPSSSVSGVPLPFSITYNSITNAVTLDYDFDKSACQVRLATTSTLPNGNTDSRYNGFLLINESGPEIVRDGFAYTSCTETVVFDWDLFYYSDAIAGKFVAKIYEWNPDSNIRESYLGGVSFEFPLS